MKIDLLPIINNQGAKIPFNGKVNLTNNDLKITTEIDGNVVNFADSLDITCHVHGTIKTVCGRCVQELSVPLVLDFNETVGVDEVELDGTILDMEDLVVKNIYANLPIRFLCSDDCKGICSKCGTNLNISKCNCEDDNIDERFAKLKNLLK